MAFDLPPLTVFEGGGEGWRRGGSGALGVEGTKDDGVASVWLQPRHAGTRHPQVADAAHTREVVGVVGVTVIGKE